jgi:hypothetical protein
MLKGIGLVVLCLALEGAFLLHAALPAGVPARAPAAAPASAGVLARRAPLAREAEQAPVPSGGARIAPCDTTTAAHDAGAPAGGGS